MTWREMEDFPKDDEEKPMKIEYLYEDGQTGKVVIWGNASCAQMKIDPICLQGLKPIKWHPI